MALELSTQEREYLVELLESAYKELRQEVHHTHTSTYKEELKAKEELLRQLLAKVKPAT